MALRALHRIRFSGSAALRYRGFTVNTGTGLRPACHFTCLNARLRSCPEPPGVGCSLHLQFEFLLPRFRIPTMFLADSAPRSTATLFSACNTPAHRTAVTVPHLHFTTAGYSGSLRSTVRVVSQVRRSSVCSDR